jgi:hypothetical protein
MGIFPIIMNIVQFWLIDSIVKASNSVSLDTDSPNADDGEQHEPLFTVPSDDEDEDEEGSKPDDVENQRPNKYSRSPGDSYRLSRDKPLSTDIPTPDETKSRAASCSSELRDQHSYPPSLSNSLSSSGSDRSKATKAATNLLKKKRRGPPAPLHIERVHQPVVNSPLVSALPVVASLPKTLPQPSIMGNKPLVIARQQNTQPEVAAWTDSWEDDEDEWAGEEEWARRNSDAMKPTTDGVWEENGKTLKGQS